MKTSEQSLYMLLTTFIQLGGRAYWDYAKSEDFELKFRFLRNFTRLWLFAVIAHAHALTWCTHDNPVHARVAPTEKQYACMYIMYSKNSRLHTSHYA